MAIFFKFAAEPAATTEGLSGNYLADLVESVVYGNDIIFHFAEDKIYLEFCPEGWLFLHLADGGFHGECQTNIAGAGFHKAALELVETIAATAGLVLHVEDETGYYNERNFDELRGYLYGWLGNLLTGVVMLSEQDGNTKGMQLCWPKPQERYLPAEIPQSVITPTGRWSIEQLKSALSHPKNFADLAQRFFIWPDESKSSWFYHNCAMARLWTDCYFMPSERSKKDNAINEQIIKELEFAVFLDEQQPIPREDYRLLCQLSQHEPLNLQNTPNETYFGSIGYRKGLITENLLGLRMIMDGHFLRGYDEDGLIFDNRLNGQRRFIRLKVYYNNDGQAKFKNLPEEDKLFTIKKDRFHLQGWYESANEAGFSEACCVQIFAGHYLFLLVLLYEQATDRQWAMQWLDKLSFVVDEENENLP